MYQVEDEPVETVHLYVIREGDKRPSLLPVIISVLALSFLIAIRVLTPYTQPEQRASIRVPAVPLFTKTFSTAIKVVPTGVKNYPATVAHGMLSISNGSVISQTLPAGFTVMATGGTQVATDAAVFVPAANADGFGMATVAAHIVVAGVNLPTLAINQVIGTSLFIRNLSPFTGGSPAYSVRFATNKDKADAVWRARNLLASEAVGLHYPCKESQFVADSKMTLTWRCQFVTFHAPSWVHVTRVILQGNSLLVDVVFVARPKHIWAK